jgi:hypothetical protein
MGRKATEAWGGNGVPRARQGWEGGWGRGRQGDGKTEVGTGSGQTDGRVERKEAGPRGKGPGQGEDGTSAGNTGNEELRDFMLERWGRRRVDKEGDGERGGRHAQGGGAEGHRVPKVSS